MRFNKATDAVIRQTIDRIAPPLDSEKIGIA